MALLRSGWVRYSLAPVCGAGAVAIAGGLEGLLGGVFFALPLARVALLALVAGLWFFQLAPSYSRACKCWWWMLRELLEDCGLRVSTAASAAEGLEALRRERPDVLVSDIAMPGASGYTLLRRVRARPAEQGGGLRR